MCFNSKLVVLCKRLFFAVLYCYTRQAFYQLKTHLQAGIPLTMEMKKPCHAGLTGQVKLSQAEPAHMYGKPPTGFHVVTQYSGKNHVSNSDIHNKVIMPSCFSLISTVPCFVAQS